MSEIHFAQVDAEKMLDEARAGLEARIGEPIQPGDARYLLLMHVMQLILGGYALIDQTGRANLLRFAQGEALDALGERVDTHRLQASPAGMTIRYELTEASAIPTIIPKGTRVTPDGVGYFSTDEALVIPAGSVYGDVPASLILTEGIASEAYNGIPAGMEMAMVDMVFGAARVTSVTGAAGGRAEEDDDAYRERIRLAPSHFAATGTADAYLYHTRSASTLVADAGVRQSAPGEVEIALLVAADAPDAAAVVQEVQAYVSDPIRRTLTDLVTVREADVAPYDIALTYYANPMRLAEVTQAIEGAGGALEQYLAWQDWRIGRDVNPDKLRALMLAAGAERIDLTAPNYTQVGALSRALHRIVTIRCEPMAEDEV